MQASSLVSSRIGVQVGAPVEEGSEKTSVRLHVEIGKSAADAQLSQSKALVGGEEVGFSAFVTFIAAPGKQQELASIIESLIEGKLENRFSKEASQVIQGGMVAVKVHQADGNKVIVQVKPGMMVEEMVTMQVTGAIQGFGIEAATTSETTVVTVNAVAGVDFNDALEGHKTDLPTLSTFGKSLNLEVVAKSPKDSLLDKKMWEIVEQFQPGNPMIALKLVKSVDIDVAFRGIDELPADLQRRLKIAKEFVKFPQTPKTREGTPEHEFFKQLVEIMEPQIEVRAAVENVGAIHLTVITPGWGKAFVTTHD